MLHAWLRLACSTQHLGTASLAHAVSSAASSPTPLPQHAAPRMEVPARRQHTPLQRPAGRAAVQAEDERLPEEGAGGGDKPRRRKVSFAAAGSYCCFCLCCPAVLRCGAWPALAAASPSLTSAALPPLASVSPPTKHQHPCTCRSARISARMRRRRWFA